MKDLSVGSQLVLAWKPARKVTLRYEGDDLFTIVESIGSKLCPGDTCHFSHIIEGLPLTLISLVRNGEVQGNYICGREHGVELVKK